MKRRRLRRWFRRAALFCLLFYGLAVLPLAALRFLNPPFTMVQVQRRVESWFAKNIYNKRYEFLPLGRIDPDLQHAVIAAEDSRFYQHHGFDWDEVKHVIEDNEARGASTLTQQLIKNLYFTTHRSRVRKAFEALLVPPAEILLGKQRILELYLNVVEWGPGVYGAEAAARWHYGVSAARVGREQAARLAAILPSPRRRRPERMHSYAAIIEQRMRQMGW
jgi:monofunctional biosynthetic peptidoglycan transglycosylase